MAKKVYTEIPDTSDMDYWEVSKVGVKLKMFVPKNRTLHRKLKQAAWEKIQASLPKKLRGKVSYADED